MFRPVLATLLVLNATAGLAGTAPTETCLAAAANDAARAACIGETARACLAGVAHPEPLDIAICLNSETEWWQARLPGAYERMAARAVELDALHQESFAQGAPRLADDLVALEASWKGWIETRCSFEAMLLRGSPQRMVAAADCMLQQTATQTLLLERGARTKP